MVLGEVRDEDADEYKAEEVSVKDSVKLSCSYSDTPKFVRLGEERSLQTAGMGSMGASLTPCWFPTAYVCTR